MAAIKIYLIAIFINFNDPKYQAKWGWFLNYIKSVDGTINTTRQIDYPRRCTNGELVLSHVTYSFNCQLLQQII